MDTLEAIMTRRSVREYTDRPVPEGTARQLLAAAMQAPDAGGEPPWHFIVIDDPEILSRIPAISPYAEVRPPAPLAILVCADLRRPENREFSVIVCAAATENLLLAAHALGLGAVWTAVYPDPDRMLGFGNLFSLPDTVAAFALVTVGYPATRPPPVDRYREDRVHRNGWCPFPDANTHSLSGRRSKQGLLTMEQRNDVREAGAPPGYPKNRAEALTDGIFAIAMTLLVLSLDVPEGLRDPSDAAIAAVLAGQLPALYHYFLAFFILASFWIVHHAQVDRLRHIDRTFLWINIAVLMFVVLVPFSVSLIGDYPGETFAAIIFEANLLFIGLLFAAQWRYATHDRRLVHPGTDIRRANQRAMVVPAVSVAAILLALSGWTWSTAIYAIIPLVMRFLPPGR